jgi:predicted nucleic acid-binding protein
MRCMLDTCVFNWLLDGVVDASLLPSPAEYFVTHVQRDEIAAERHAARRAQLFARLGELKPVRIPTESWALGISRVGDFRLSEGVEFRRILDALDKKKRRKNNRSDALIAETALRNTLTLISADGALCDVMREFGGSVIQFRKNA